VGELTQVVRERLRALFLAEAVAEAEHSIAACVGSLEAKPGHRGLDRILLAILRVSGGDPARLESAIELAKRDWRDILVAAEFADDLLAHQRWVPRRFDEAVLERWMAGDLPPGVKFGPREVVEDLDERQRGQRGTVVALLALEPQPRYLVEQADGGRFEAWQRLLSRARDRGR
jgi:hypothetical protein